MGKMETFTIRDLRLRTGELVRRAEAGKLSVVSKRGQPVFVAVPFEEGLIEKGVRVELAVKLYEEEIVSLGRAAKVAALTLGEMVDELGRRKIPVVRHDAGEIRKDLKTVERTARRR